MKKVVLSVALALMLAGTAFANTWLNGASNTQDWYNAANWSTTILPVAGESLNLTSVTTSHGIIIDGLGGTRQSAQSGYFQWGPWQKTTSNILITNGATLNITGNFYAAANSSDAAHSPTIMNLTIDGGSKVNVTGDAQVGRFQGGAGLNTLNQLTINIDGPQTVWHQLGTSKIMNLGWSTAAVSVPTLVNLTNGASIVVEMVGGFVMNNNTLGQDLAKVNLAGGSLILKGDRRGQLTTIGHYLERNWIVGYDGKGTVQYDYDITNPGYTTIWATPEPATLSLLAVGVLALFGKKK